MACSGCRQLTIPEKLKSIADGWKHLVWSDKETEAMAYKRAKICSECAMNKAQICKECGCYLPAKIRSKVEKCPIAKWE